MSTEDLIAMARQAGAWPELSETKEKDVDFLRRFAKLIEARTREECAKVAEAGVADATDWDSSYWDQACQNRAKAIRSMGERT